MLKGTSLPRRKNGSEAWLKENAKSLKSNTEASLKSILKIDSKCVGVECPLS